MYITGGSVREYNGYLILLGVESDHALGAGILIRASDAGKEEDHGHFGS